MSYLWRLKTNLTDSIIGWTAERTHDVKFLTSHRSAQQRITAPSARAGLVGDTCRAPCIWTWPCSASCTPAGCRLWGRPRSGQGRSASVRAGSDSGWMTWWVRFSSRPVQRSLVKVQLILHQMKIYSYHSKVIHSGSVTMSFEWREWNLIAGQPEEETKATD